MDKLRKEILDQCDMGGKEKKKKKKRDWSKLDVRDDNDNLNLKPEKKEKGTSLSIRFARVCKGSQRLRGVLLLFFFFFHYNDRSF